MKTLKPLFLLIFSVLLLSCSDDDDDDEFKFDAKSLYQTTWEGTSLITDGDETISTTNVVIQFFTTDEGQYILKSEGLSTRDYEFKYSIEGKIMDIDGPVLDGKYTLLEITKDKMILVTMSSYTVTLTLYRKY